YASVRPVGWFRMDWQFGWIRRPELMAPAGAFDRGFPDVAVTFPDEPAFTLADQPDFLHLSASARIDTRDNHGYPMSGGLYSGTFTSYSDRGSGTFSFDRYETEAAQFVPLLGNSIVLAFHGWAVLSDVPAGHD